MVFYYFFDDRSRYTWVYFIRKESDFFEYFKEFKSMVEFFFGNSIKILISDQGGEYKSREFNQYCKRNGTLQKFTVPHTPR